MSSEPDQIVIPAGFILESDLLAWLRMRRDDARAMGDEYREQGDHDDAAEWYARADAFGEVVLHVAY